MIKTNKQQVKEIKRKLKRRGNEIYNKYLFNSIETIKYIIECVDNKVEIDDNKCEVIFYCDETYLPQFYELITYYPNKLKELKFIYDYTIKEMYQEYGDSIDIMNNNKKSINIRGGLLKAANRRAKEFNREINIKNEELKLPRKCCYLDIEISYSNNKPQNNSPSLDRIDNSKGYVTGNIQIISMLANSMKSSATVEQLLTFSNNIQKIHG